jgi:hypothetical protein
MRQAALVGVIVLASLVGCSHLRPSASAGAPTAPSVVSPSAPRVASDSSSPRTDTSPDATASTSKVEPPTAIPPSRPEPTPASPSSVDSLITALAPGPAAPGRASTAPAAAVARPAAAPASKQASASTAVDRPPAPPSLDLAALEQRLRDTHAVGLFTKLSLKNQVDDLLGQFRAYYRGDKTIPTSQLRQRYDGLLLKVLSVLQDGDPPLASQIWSSREAIWGVLADPAKFEKI